ncbi:hypothetical protein EV426DRAFT_713264 [Tirmania nivea]|nr:hypothetical protein EV426DRAFT_713264 [Tirmania nivea]
MITSGIEWDILINDYLTLALYSESDKLLTLTDSTVSVQALLNLSRDTSPRSGIKKELKNLLHKRAHQETAIGWVRSHRHLRAWEDLDTPIWRKGEGEEEEWDPVEMYFAYLYQSIGK